ncbi:MAG: hypothetical protein M0R06_07460 [Sphaerochaeta sp.]|jgi:hypothetical protein|nr:hypothetical protein [Sphaerochaeta sp.]
MSQPLGDKTQNRKFEGDVVRLWGLGPELVTDKANIHPYKFLDGFEGHRVRVTVVVERTCSCGRKTFNESGDCWKCEEDERAFEEDFS